MGVYIPPPNDGDDKDEKEHSKTDGSKLKNYPSKSSSSTSIVIPNPATWIPRNPSVGLFTGPLTPASDNLPALYSMVGLQLVIGMFCLRTSRRIYKGLGSGQPLYQGANGLPIYPSRSRTLFKALIPGVAGVGTIFGCGLEISRLCLPYDPWFDEAKHYRKLATKNGNKPSAWFGAYNYYRPMTMSVWSDKLGDWIKHAEQSLESQPGHTPKSSILNKLHDKGNYTEVYHRLVESNTSRRQELQDNFLDKVNELNKAERIDSILDGTSPYINPNYLKPHIQLRHNSIQSDDDFDMVWLNFDPWEELKLETSYDLRLIIHRGWEAEAAEGSEALAEGSEALAEDI